MAADAFPLIFSPTDLNFSGASPPMVSADDYDILQLPWNVPRPCAFGGRGNVESMSLPEIWHHDIRDSGLGHAQSSGSAAYPA